MLGRSNLRGWAIIVQREEVFPAGNGNAGYQQTHGSETVIAPSEEEKGRRRLRPSKRRELSASICKLLQGGQIEREAVATEQDFNQLHCWLSFLAAGEAPAASQAHAGEPSAAATANIPGYVAANWQQTNSGIFFSTSCYWAQRLQTQIRLQETQTREQLFFCYFTFVILSWLRLY